MREIWIGLAIGSATGAIVGMTGSVAVGIVLCGAAGLTVGCGFLDQRQRIERLERQREATGKAAPPWQASRGWDAA
ncbi:hypothetical protein [Labrys wisconsinensis]|uniref:Amino acid dehydrogenase n=1 Tax=Labrys wisconsinensis TaxID=425677 RepID=A0ABU0JGS2_9HYPH|nr:hypothetical protein [Labrys wisconsinensis]MDQ0472785.1 putative amino acid dehydrogenase [Labrys wisconsinensis]